MIHPWKDLHNLSRIFSSRSWLQRVTKKNGMQFSNLLVSYTPISFICIFCGTQKEATKDVAFQHGLSLSIHNWIMHLNNETLKSPCRVNKDAQITYRVQIRMTKKGRTFLHGLHGVDHHREWRCISKRENKFPKPAKVLNYFDWWIYCRQLKHVSSLVQETFTSSLSDTRPFYQGFRGKGLLRDIVTNKIKTR